MTTGKQIKKIVKQFLTRSLAKDMVFGQSLIIVIVVLLTVSIGNRVISRYDAHTSQENLDKQLAYLKSSLELPLWNIDLVGIEKLGLSFIDNSQIVLLKIVDSEGTILFEHDTHQKDNITSGEGSIFHDSENLGTVYLTLSRLEAKKRNEQLILSALITSLIILIVLVGSTTMLVRYFLQRPMHQLLKAIEQITQGEYDHQLMSSQQTEIGKIISKFQEMARRIKNRQRNLTEANRKLAYESEARHQVAQELQKHREHLEELVEERTKELSLAIKAEEKRIQLSYEIDNELDGKIAGDPGRLGQILINLISNGIKFTQAGSVVLRATKLEETVQSIIVLFEVEDTGIGIAKEDQGELFESFLQLDSSATRRYGGTGLGLAISKKLVEMMDGSIGVRSEKGKGARFWFTATFAKMAESDLEEQRAVLEPGSQNQKILLAEDNIINQQVALSILEKLGYQTQAVEGGDQVVPMLEQSDYDLILMDIQMPGLDGYETTKLIRNSGKEYRNIPIVAMTANAMAGTRGKCLEAGMNDYLAKPVEPKQMSEILTKWLSSSKEVREKQNLQEEGQTL